MTLEAYSLLNVSEIGTNTLAIPVHAFFHYNKDIHIIC